MLEAYTRARDKEMREEEKNSFGGCVNLSCHVEINFQQELASLVLYWSSGFIIIQLRVQDRISASKAEVKFVSFKKNGTHILHNFEISVFYSSQKSSTRNF